MLARPDQVGSGSLEPGKVRVIERVYMWMQFPLLDAPNEDICIGPSEQARPHPSATQDIECLVRILIDVQTLDQLAAPRAENVWHLPSIHDANELVVLQSESRGVHRKHLAGPGIPSVHKPPKELQQ